MTVSFRIFRCKKTNRNIFLFFSLFFISLINLYWLAKGDCMTKSNASVSCYSQNIYKDSVGNIWYGLANNLFRTYSDSVRSYSFAKTNFSTENVSYTFLESSNLGLLVGTSSGLWVFDSETEQFVHLFSDVLSDVHVLASHQEILYVGTGLGLFVVRNNNISKIEIANKGQQQITGIMIDDEHQVWISTPAGLIRYTPQKEELTHFIVNQNGTPLVYEVVEHMKAKEHESKYILIICIISFIVFLFFLFFNSSIHNKIKSKKSDVEEIGEELNNDRNEEKYINTKRISEEEATCIIECLKKYMDHDKVYLDPDLKRTDLAKKTGCSQAVLSQIFSQHLQLGYNDYINSYRIEEFKRIVKAGYNERYTLEGLSKLCGFNSQASFFRSFRKNVGMTPNEYIQRENRKDS